MKIGFVLIFILVSRLAFGQEPDYSIAKNTLGCSASEILIRGNCSINYERLLKGDYGDRYFINVGYGGLYFFKNTTATDNKSFVYLVSSYSIPVSLNIVKGSGNHHFEMDFGVHFLINETADGFFESDHNKYAPGYNKAWVKALVNLGYRYQKPQKGIIFRSYVGLFGIGLGLGYAF